MAEKKILVFACDRCGREHRRSTRGKQAAPKGWVEVLGRDICDTCVPYLESWLESRPIILVQDDEVSPLRIHRDVDQSNPAVQEIIHQWGQPVPSVWVSQNDDGERVVNVARPEN